MIDSPSANPSAEQARLELSVAAAAAERADRPRYLVWLAGLLVVVASVVLISAFSKRTAETLRLSKARAAVVELEKKKADLDALSASIQSSGLDSDIKMVPRLESMATAVGLKLQGNISDSEEIGNLPGGMTKRQYTARIAPGEDPKAILDWLASTQDPNTIKRLEITQLRFTPATDATKVGGLSVEVRFSRFEKKETRR